MNGSVIQNLTQSLMHGSREVNLGHGLASLAPRSTHAARLRGGQRSNLHTLRASVEDNLKSKGITLPPSSPPAANYVPWLVTGKYIYVSGQLPMKDGKIQCTGKVGTDVKLEDAYQSARTCGLNIIAQAKAAAGGDLDKIKRVVKLVGFVQSAADFHEQHKVINGASDVMCEVFGEKGMHARSAVGTNALPFNVATEIEAVFELE